MKKHLIITCLAAAALTGCAHLSAQDQGTLDAASQAAQEARQQSVQAAEDARAARADADRAARAAQAASDRADRIFQQGQNK